MKKFKTTWVRLALLFLCGLLSNNVLIAQTDSLNNRENNQKIVNNSRDISNQDESNKNVNNETSDGENSKYQRPIITEPTIKIISIGFFVIMILLIILFFVSKMKSGNPYFGFHSIKFVGLILIFPGICILALISEELIGGATLAALFGTIAGYVLSRDKEDDSDSSGKSNLENENKELSEKFLKLEAEIESLKQVNT